MIEDVYRRWKILPMSRSDKVYLYTTLRPYPTRVGRPFFKKSSLAMNTSLIQKSQVYVCLVARVLYSLFLDIK